MIHEGAMMGGIGYEFGVVSCGFWVGVGDFDAIAAGGFVSGVVFAPF